MSTASAPEPKPTPAPAHARSLPNQLPALYSGVLPCADCEGIRYELDLRADSVYFLCVNASNQDKDYEHIVLRNHFDATVENAGGRYAQLAIQGPRAKCVKSRVLAAACYTAKQ